MLVETFCIRFSSNNVLLESSDLIHTVRDSPSYVHVNIVWGRKQTKQVGIGRPIRSTVPPPHNTGCSGAPPRAVAP